VAKRVRLRSRPLALCLGVVAILQSAGSAQAWTDSGRSTTVAQARAKLLAHPRIWAVDRSALAFGFRYVLVVGAIRAIRPSGPAVMVDGKPTWRRFEVLSAVRLLSGLPEFERRFDDHPGIPLGEPTMAGYCLHAAGKSFWLTGFDTEFAMYRHRIGLGCQDTPKARAQVGGPQR
jgi:hypothetical protein